MRHLTAISIAPNARGWQVHTRQARVLNIFDRVCNLINDSGEVLSIAAPEIGNGPFNILLKDLEFSFLNYLEVGSPITVGINRVAIGEVMVDTHQAKPWSPCPDWEQLHALRDLIGTELLTLKDWIQPRAPTNSVIEYLKTQSVMQVIQDKSHEFFEAGWGLRQSSSYTIHPENAYSSGTRPSQTTLHTLASPKVDFVQPAFESARELCSSVIHAEIRGGNIAAQHLAGLGPGLTPAGDDFILGAILAARIIHPEELANILTKELAEAAAPLTTSLSAAWLRAAGRGEAGVMWHNFFAALSSGDQMAVQNAAVRLLAIGHTSGADTLAGFLSTFFFFINTRTDPCLF